MEFNEKFKEELEKHKAIIFDIGSGKLKTETLNSLQRALQRQSLMLALYYADYKCETCKTEKDLTHQHLIKRRASYFISKSKFYATRHYFFNTAILCKECHAKADYLPETLRETMLTITEKTISIAKTMFKEGEENENIPVQQMQLQVTK